jgi:predicted GNAT family acetyltransferase
MTHPLDTPPFLHAVASNVNAIRLYKELGFTYRRDIRFRRLTLAGTA